MASAKCEPGGGGGGGGAAGRARGVAGRALLQRLPHGPRRAPGFPSPSTRIEPLGVAQLQRGFLSSLDLDRLIAASIRVFNLWEMRFEFAHG